MKIEFDKDEIYSRALQVAASFVIAGLVGVGAWGGHVIGGFFGAILGLIILPGVVILAVMARMWKDGGN